MSTGFLVALGALVAEIAVVSLAAIPAEGQIPTTATKTRTAARTAKPWTPPRTPWGDPDLQGLWPSIDMQGTPYERPVELSQRAVLTDEELETREAQSRRQAEADAETFVVQRPRSGAGTGPPSHWGEHGTPSRQASLVVDPPDGRMPPLTPEGQKRAMRIRSTYDLDAPGAVEAPFNDFDDLGPYDRCLTRGILASMLPTGYNMGNQIFQIPGHVVIRNEMIHETRIIPLDGRPHIGQNIRQYMGDSRGRWEGDTLVVETTNFNGKVGLTRNGNSTPTSQDIRLVERFTRVDADTIQYEVTIDDPKTWTRPWTVALPLKQHPEYGMFEYACHEGNYAMTHILSGARAQEASGRP